MIARLVLALLLLAPARAGALDETIRTIPSRPGVTESFVLIRPASAPVASVVLFTGGRGALGLQRMGDAPAVGGLEEGAADVLGR
jgi:hypothetical protein